jgi:hypothetical protein
MSPARHAIEEYTALLARAFNGAIEVDGTRIVAHPSGTLLARTPRPAAEMVSDTISVPTLWASDRDDDWSQL